MLLSMALRAYYVSIISIYENQHDSGNPFEQGHLAYIAYLINNGQLPDFDVSKVDQFWHPPLHYALSAMLLKVSWFIFPSQNGNYEIAQLWPFLYITFAIFLIWRILKYVFPEDNMAVNVALAFAAFQPSFLIRSATLNADAMATFISVAMLFFLFRHIYDAHKSDIVWMLVLFIIGMWTKKSVLLAALTIGFVLLYELIFEKKKDFYKALLLMIVASPVSLGWYIRLYMLWKIPFNFVWSLKDYNLVPGYIKDASILKRITDFSPAHFTYQYTYVRSNVEAVDINPLTVLIKTSANDLWQWSYENDAITKLSYIILLLRLLFVIAVSVGFIVLVLQKNMPKTKIAVISFVVLNLISFYIFAFENPFIHTMNYRYVEPIILCEAIAVGLLAKKGKLLFIGTALSTLALAGALALKIVLL